MTTTGTEQTQERIAATGTEIRPWPHNPRLTKVHAAAGSPALLLAATLLLNLLRLGLAVFGGASAYHARDNPPRVSILQ